MLTKTPQHAVAVTGMGIVSSLGEGLTLFKDALRDGRSNFVCSSLYPMLSFPVIGAFIQNFDFSQSLSLFATFAANRRQAIEKILLSQPRPLQMALIAALQAWQQGAVVEYPLDATRIGLIVAAQNASTHYQYDLYPSFKEEPDYLSPKYALQFMDTNYVGVISAILGILGEGFTVGGASASGNMALISAYHSIRDKRQDACLVVGALADLSPMEFQGFHNLGAMGGSHFADQPNKACRPFDEAHEGFIYGQASACLLLESLDSVEKRKVPALAYILGGASCLDGNYLSSPSVVGEVRIIEQAIKVAGVKVEDINYINSHGTSSPAGDKTEAEAISAALGEHSKKIMVNATKSLTGHCLWSAGIVEAIATILQMEYGFVHTNKNLVNPITKKFNLIKGDSTPYQIEIAISNAFGFGGINTAIVLANKNHQTF